MLLSVLILCISGLILIYRRRLRTRYLRSVPSSLASVVLCLQRGISTDLWNGQRLFVSRGRSESSSSGWRSHQHWTSSWRPWTKTLVRAVNLFWIALDNTPLSVLLTSITTGLCLVKEMGSVKSKCRRLCSPAPFLYLVKLQTKRYQFPFTVYTSSNLWFFNIMAQNWPVVLMKVSISTK